MEQAAEVMRWYRDFILRRPTSINGFFAFLTVPPGAAVPRGAAPQEDVRRRLVLHRLRGRGRGGVRPDPRKFGPPAFDFVGPMPFPALAEHVRRALPAGLQWYWRADFVNELSDEAIELHVEYGSQLPTLLSTMHLYPINGAAQRVGKQRHGLELSRRQLGRR